MDCYIWYSEDGPAAPPLLAVPYGMGPENTGNSQSSSTVYRQVYEKTSTDDVTQASRRFRYSQVDRDLAADHKVSAGLRDSDLQQFPENCGRSAVLPSPKFYRFASSTSVFSHNYKLQCDICHSPYIPRSLFSRVLFNPLECKGNYSATSIMKLVNWPLMGELLHLRFRPDPSSLYRYQM